MKKFFFIDFDNTIFSHRTGSIPESALQALSALRKDGHKFILATGRDIRRDSADFAGYHLHPDCLISANGAVVEAEGNILSDTFFDPDLQKRLLDFIFTKKYSLTARIDDQWYAFHLKPAPFLKRRKVQAQILTEKDFGILYKKSFRAFFLPDSPEAIQDVQKHFPELDLLRMGEELGGADVVPAGNNKARGIPLILNYYGASVEDAVAIGDSMNDLEMIRLAGLGIAMGNAMPEVQRAADYVAKDVDESGLSDAIRYALHRQRTSAVSPPPAED